MAPVIVGSDAVRVQTAPSASEAAPSGRATEAVDRPDRAAVDRDLQRHASKVDFTVIERSPLEAEDRFAYHRIAPYCLTELVQWAM